MKGPEHAKRVVAVYLTAGIPAKVDQLEARLDLDAGDPRQQLLETARAGEVLTGAPRRHDGEWPVIFVEGRDTARLVEEAAGDYVVTYRLRLWLFARGQEHTETDARRDRLALAVRELLLEQPELGHVPADDDDGDARVNPASIVESFGDVGVDAGGRTVAASYLDVEVDVAERVYVEVIAEAPIDLPVEPSIGGTIDDQLAELGLV